MKPELIAQIRPEDMPTDDLRDIARILGVPVAVRLLKMFSGRSVYFRSYWQMNFVARYVAEHWDGTNAEELAKDLDVTYQSVWNATNNKRVRGPGGGHSKPNQLDLFRKDAA